jgi:hypothetical protein
MVGGPIADSTPSRWPRGEAGESKPYYSNRIDQATGQCHGLALAGCPAHRTWGGAHLARYWRAKRKEQVCALE